ncbi:MAG: hypothetical protein KAS02_00250 [Candidatus Pacebacteria bacterium]|nr:hypothetical protein [Candidatus Paceibacterota bacterium]
MAKKIVFYGKEDFSIILILLNDTVMEKVLADIVKGDRENGKTMPIIVLKDTDIKGLSQRLFREFEEDISVPIGEGLFQFKDAEDLTKYIQQQENI